jgi:voltage-gated sodium channel
MSTTPDRRGASSPAASTIAHRAESGETRLSQFVASTAFSGTILAFILVNAVLIGWETYAPSAAIAWGLKACLLVFVVELVLKITAAVQTRTVPAFFRDGWNIFDLVVVVGSFIPAVGPLGPILRVIRVLRVFRLVRSIPELRLIVTVLLRSIVSMKYIALLAFVVFYIYAVIGVQLFGRHLPEYASIHEAFFTLFRVLTGDNWTDLRYGVAEAVAGSSDAALAWKSTAYHVSWIVVSTFLLINLIVGAVLNNYQEVQNIEHHRKAVAKGELDTSDERLAELVSELDRTLKARAALRDEAALGDEAANKGRPDARPVSRPPGSTP